MNSLANSIGARRSQRLGLVARIALLATVACSEDGGTMGPATGIAGAAAGAPVSGTAGTGAAPTGVAGSTPGAAGGSAGTGTTTPQPRAGTMAMPTATAGTAAMPDAGPAATPDAGADAGPGPDAGPGTDPGSKPAGDPSGWNDPGPEPFEEVPEAMAAEVCKIDVGMLRSRFWAAGAVFRYGKLCFKAGTIDRPYGVFSVTKTVAGTVMAAAYLETRDNPMRILPSDAISKWGGSGSTRISEFAGMVTSGRFSYDTLGTNLARTGAPMENSLGQGSAGGEKTLEAVRDKLFKKLGVGGSWPTGTWGTGANISLTDMGRLGIALAHNGWWNGEQVLDPKWTYWMTHPHHENLNTSYGMYMWLNHRGNATGIGGTLDASGAGPAGGDPCAPAAVWKRYPHPPSEATDCRPAMGNTCKQTYDVGVFSAQGLGGQFIVAHRGLDLVMVAQNYSGQGGPMGMWEAVRPALVAHDPMFKGDEAAFCKAYGAGDYAPDLIVEPVQPDMQ